MLLFSEYSRLPNPKDYWYNSLVVNYSYFWFALFYLYFKIFKLSLLHTNYLLSTTHSILMNILVFTVLPNFNFSASNLITGSNHWVDFILGINNGYLIYDIFWIYFNYADMKIDSQKYTKLKLIHHTFYLGLCYLSVRFSIGSYINTLLLLNTFTTPFLNWRRYNKHRNIPYSKKIINDTLFFGSFLGVRVLFNVWFCTIPLQNAIVSNTVTVDFTLSQTIVWYTLIMGYYTHLLFNLVWFGLVSKRITVQLLHYIITKYTNKKVH